VYQFPKEPKKIRERTRRYERELQKEREKFGFIDDGFGKRYLLGPLYMVLGDTVGAIKSFEWFERAFPDDIGDLEAAAQKLRQTMLSNLYLIPHLLGSEQEELDIWHASNLERKDYVEYAPHEILGLWDEEALQWVNETYHSPEFRQIRERYIEIYRQLRSEPPGPKRSQLVEEAFRLQNMG
jgi:hypothetical protein